MQKKCKKMQDYLHIWKIFCTFASDLGIVPSVTIKYIEIMKKRCVFRIEVEGCLWRVIECPITPNGSKLEYRIMHKRRVLFKCRGIDARYAIETACRFALGCGVDINWGIVL